MDVLGPASAGLVELLRSIVLAVAELLGVGETEVAFAGGILAAVIIGWVLFRWLEWVAHASDAAHPQAVVHLTHLTPLQVFRNSLGNAFRAAGFLVMLEAGVFAVVDWALLSDVVVTALAGFGLFLLGSVMSGNA